MTDFSFLFLDVCFEFWSEIFRGYFNMCCEHAWFFSDLFTVFKFEFKPHVTRWHEIGACHLICGDAGAKKKIFFLHQVNEKNTPFFTLHDMRSGSTRGSTVIGSARRPPPPHLISSTVSQLLWSTTPIHIHATQMDVFVDTSIVVAVNMDRRKYK